MDEGEREGAIEKATEEGIEASSSLIINICLIAKVKVIPLISD